MEFSDVWADTSQPGVSARASILVRYTGNADPADDLATPAPLNGLINYPRAHPADLEPRPRCQHLHRLPCRHAPGSTCAAPSPAPAG